jgi:hypothetical protein
MCTRAQALLGMLDGLQMKLGEAWVCFLSANATAHSADKLHDVLTHAAGQRVCRWYGQHFFVARNDKHSGAGRFTATLVAAAAAGNEPYLPHHHTAR